MIQLIRMIDQLIRLILLADAPKAWKTDVSPLKFFSQASLFFVLLQFFFAREDLIFFCMPSAG